MQQFLDIKSARKFVEQAMKHYLSEKSPGWFTNWLDELYIRLHDDLKGVSLYEMAILDRLYENGWMPQQLAVNLVYKMFDHLGRDTTGIIGY